MMENSVIESFGVNRATAHFVEFQTKQTFRAAISLPLNFQFPEFEINKPPWMTSGNDIHIDPNRRLTIKRSFLPTVDGSQSSTLFDATDFASSLSTYNILSPGRDAAESQNPPLIAIGLKCDRSRALAPKAVFRPLPGQPRLNPLNSLITRKPLSSLREVPEKPDQQELERLGLLFKDDPITYFQKHREGTGHRLIYLVYARPRDDALFSPYELQKVPNSETGTDYFTMSATGVTHTDDSGNSEQSSLASWCREKQIFDSMHILPFFRKFVYWKPFRFWRTYVMKERFLGLMKDAKEMPFFENGLVTEKALEIAKLVREVEEDFREFLLSIFAGRKYSVDDYRRL
jgi:hypothetical protein